jgi:hypothetical protein
MIIDYSNSAFTRRAICVSSRGSSVQDWTFAFGNRRAGRNVRPGFVSPPPQAFEFAGMRSQTHDPAGISN